MHLIAHVSYPCAEPLRSGLTLGTLSRPAALPPLVLLSSRASAHCTSIMERCSSLCRIRTNAGVTGEEEIVLGFQNPIEELGQEDVTPSGTLTVEIANIFTSEFSTIRTSPPISAMPCALHVRSGLFEDE